MLSFWYLCQKPSYLSLQLSFTYIVVVPNCNYYFCSSCFSNIYALVFGLFKEITTAKLIACWFHEKHIALASSGCSRPRPWITCICTLLSKHSIFFQASYPFWDTYCWSFLTIWEVAPLSYLSHRHHTKTKWIMKLPIYYINKHKYQLISWGARILLLRLFLCRCVKRVDKMEYALSSCDIPNLLWFLYGNFLLLLWQQ